MIKISMWVIEVYLSFLLILEVHSWTGTDHFYAIHRYDSAMGFRQSLFKIKIFPHGMANRNHSLNVTFDLNLYSNCIEMTIDDRQDSSRLVKLTVERPDQMENVAQHLIFIIIRAGSVVDTYVECKMMDSYSMESILRRSSNDSDSIDIQLDMLYRGSHYLIPSNNESALETMFNNHGCHSNSVYRSIITDSQFVNMSFLPKIEHFIEEFENDPIDHDLNKTLRSLTFLYWPNADFQNINKTFSFEILRIPQLKFRIFYEPKEKFIEIDFGHQNHRRSVLDVDKREKRSKISKNTQIIIEISPNLISTYSECELIDREYSMNRSLFDQLVEQVRNQSEIVYDRRSVAVLFNESIDEVAKNLLCNKLDSNEGKILSVRLTYKKLIHLIHRLLYHFENLLQFAQHYGEIKKNSTEKQNISSIDVPKIDGYGSLKAQDVNLTMNMRATVVLQETIAFGDICSIDIDCKTNVSSMLCHSSRCVCPSGFFWSSSSKRCVICQDLLVGNRCFHLSNHKSTWYQANDYCQNEHTVSENLDYIMKLASNLSLAEIQYIRERLANESNNNQDMNYVYWIGANSYLDTKTLHQLNHRTRRQLRRTEFRWYDNEEIARINLSNLWCSKIVSNTLSSQQQNGICVSIASCGLHAEDCQRHDRFICEAF